MQYGKLKKPEKTGDKMKKWLSRLIIAVVLIAGGIIAYMFALYGLMSEVSQGAPISGHDPQKAALLVIDVQESLTGRLATGFSAGMKAQSEGLVTAINKTVAWAEANRIPIVYIRQENTDFIYNLATGAMLAKGSPGAEIDGRIKISGANIFGKQKMDAFTNRELDDYMRSRGVGRLYVTGLDAEYCVDRTIKGGLARGYKVTAVKDAIISSTPEKRDKKIADYAAGGVRIINSDEFSVEGNDSVLSQK